jgi:hypothetical protein
MCADIGRDGPLTSAARQCNSQMEMNSVPHCDIEFHASLPDCTAIHNEPSSLSLMYLGRHVFEMTQIA